MQIFGHRGSRATHAENTIPGFLHAMACGADGVELDVAVSLDDALVVTHDLVLPGDGRIVREHRAADLPLPILEELLRLASPENFWFDIEAKSAAGLTPDPRRYAQLLSQAIRRSAAQDSIAATGRANRILRSFDHEILRAFHEVGPEIPLAALIDYASDDWVTIARRASASIISPRYSTVTAERVLEAHEAGIRVGAWTVNDPADWVRLTAMGVDTIITDDPGAAVLFIGKLF